MRATELQRAEHGKTLYVLERAHHRACPRQTWSASSASGFR
jgi:hypothetical protein